MPRIITVTSGKGGVGKTNISVNLALYLAEEGRRTCLFDADMGLANADILLGIHPELGLEDVILEKRSLKDILIKDCMGIDIVPGSSGIERMADPRPEELELLVKTLSGLEGYDFLIIDTSAGISRNVVSFCMASPEVILVVTPEPTSLTDAYSLLKILSINGFKDPVMVAVNQCRNVEISGMVYSKFKAAVEKYLPIKIVPIGTILADDHVVEAVKRQKPFVSLFPGSNASKGIKNMGRHLLKKDKGEIKDPGLDTFWTRCIRMFSDPIKLTVPRKVREQTAPEGVVTKAPDNEGVKPDATGIPLQENYAVTPQPQGPAPSLEAGKEDVGHKDIPFLLERLTRGISDISMELGAIRGILERNLTDERQEIKGRKAVVYR